MTNTKLSLENFQISDLTWTWRDDWHHNLTTESFKFQIVSGHGKMPWPPTLIETI